MMKRLLALILAVAMLIPAVSSQTAAAQSEEGCGYDTSVPVVCRSYLNVGGKSPRGLVLIVIDLGDHETAVEFVETLLGTVLDMGGTELDTPRLSRDVTAIAHATPERGEMHTVLAVARQNLAIVISAPGPEEIDLDLHTEVYALIDDAIVDNTPLTMDILPEAEEIPGVYALSVEGSENVDSTSVSATPSATAEGTPAERGDEAAPYTRFKITNASAREDPQDPDAVLVSFTLMVEEDHPSVLVSSTCFNEAGDELSAGHTIVKPVVAGELYDVSAVVLDAADCVEIVFKVFPEKQ